MAQHLVVACEKSFYDAPVPLSVFVEASQQLTVGSSRIHVRLRLPMKKTLRFAGNFAELFDVALRLIPSVQAQAILVLIEAPTDWDEIAAKAGDIPVVMAADSAELLEGAEEAGLSAVAIDMPKSSVHDKLSQGLLEAAAEDMLHTGSNVIALFGAFESGGIDSLSIITLKEHLGRLTVRDLRQLETSVPLETLQSVVNLAVEIGREGREGKPVGTIFVVGDQRKVLSLSHPQGFDPVKGYNRKERDLRNARVREGVKEIAQMDGAFVISSDGIILGACRYIDASAQAITLSKGLGSRHWAAAAISHASKAIAVAVSESDGTVRLFQNGEVMLRIEPARRPIRWKEYEYEPPEASD
ncbi:MAG: diadenylate cyclase [Pirellulales bacterium]|nr:diadenylate cyclase [Pirellulales bacterium]